jgi:lycopene cyclase domain-containing protein
LIGGVFLLAVAILGGLALTKESTLYLGLITAWAAPILLLQWMLGYKRLMRDLKTWVPVAALATLYLGSADLYAISSGIWEISERYTTGFHIAGLPIEEGLFFLVTNLLVTWGLLLYHDFVTTSRRPRP